MHQLANVFTKPLAASVLVLLGKKKMSLGESIWTDMTSSTTKGISLGERKLAHAEAKWARGPLGRRWGQACGTHARREEMCTWENPGQAGGLGSEELAGGSSGEKAQSRQNIYFGF